MIASQISIESSKVFFSFIKFLNDNYPEESNEEFFFASRYKEFFTLKKFFRIILNFNVRDSKF